MSLIGLLTGLLAAINQVLRLRRPDDEEDEDVAPERWEQIDQQLDEVEARLREQDARWEALKRDNHR